MSDGYGTRFYSKGEEVGLFENNEPIFNMIFQNNCLSYLGETKYSREGRAFGISYHDHCLYVGYHEKDKKDNSFGTIYFRNGDIYRGFMNSQWTGFGQLFQDDGLIYSGDLVKEKFHGFGSLCQARQIYTGYFRDGDKHGFGVALFSNKFYIGEFKDGQRDGFGYLYDINDNLIYRGDWQCNKFSGFGCYYYEDGSKYIGDFEGDKAHGYGKFYFSNGDRYLGEYKEGQRDGFGVFYDAKNNLICRGELKKDKIHGFGEYYFTDGVKYVGEFREDTFGECYDEEQMV